MQITAIAKIYSENREAQVYLLKLLAHHRSQANTESYNTLGEERQKLENVASQRVAIVTEEMKRHGNG